MKLLYRALIAGETMSDVVERLERFAKEGAGVAVLIDAASEIKQLRAEVERLRKLAYDPTGQTYKASCVDLHARAIAAEQDADQLRSNRPLR